MGYNHYRFARRIGAGIQIKSPDVASYPAIDLQDAGAIVLRALTGTGKVYMSMGTGHALSVYVDSGDSCLDTVSSNQNLYLKPVGTGKVKFGTHTATGDAVSNGSIDILDLGGTPRKLMTKA